jgi:hypothetical protein
MACDLRCLMSSTSFFLLEEVKNFFNPKDSSYMYLLPSLLVNFLINYLELCNIVTFLFLTIPLKFFLHIPGIPIEVVAVNLLSFAISI